eukprot:3849325-Lingulodinium_polyedra.AAC.1
MPTPACLRRGQSRRLPWLGTESQTTSELASSPLALSSPVWRSRILPNLLRARSAAASSDGRGT